MVKYIPTIAYFCLFALLTVATTNWASQFYLFDLLSSIKFQLLILLLLLASISFLFHKRLGSICLLLTLSIGLFQYEFVNQQATQSTAQFEVSQLNLSYENSYIDELFGTRLSVLSDLTVLFEVNDNKRREFIDLRSDYFDYGSAEVEGFPDGIGVISKFPIIKRKKHVVFKNSVKGVIIELVIAFGASPLRLFVMHPPSPRNNNLWQKRNQMLQYLSFLLEQPSQIKHSLVIADFNTPPWSSNFPNITNMAACSDYTGHYTSWQGTSSTILPDWLTGIAIDNCLLSNSLTVTKFTTSKVAGSDHKLLRYKVNVSEF